MKAVYLAFAVMAAATQVYSQCIPPCAAGIAPVYAPSCGCPAPALVAAPAPVIAAPPPVLAAPAPVLAAPAPVLAAPAVPTVVATNSVAANLADTLSLLTVTSLLAETLPYGYPVVAPPVGYPGCGCGYGYVL